MSNTISKPKKMVVEWTNKPHALETIALAVGLVSAGIIPHLQTVMQTDVQPITLGKCAISRVALSLRWNKK